MQVHLLQRREVRPQDGAGQAGERTGVAKGDGPLRHHIALRVHKCTDQRRLYYVRGDLEPHQQDIP
eukprot:33160-Eustigmatos_ZCMA.PRE.1